MATRSINNTAINFGLVNVPVGVHTARTSHDVEFHQHHGGAGGCYGSVGQKRVCKSCEKEVAYVDIVSGFVRGEDDIVYMTKDEVDTVEREAGKSLDVVQFCHADEIDTMLYEAPFYLVPKDDSLKGYRLICRVLHESDRVGIVRYTARGTTHLAALRVIGDAETGTLVLQNISWPDEIREPDFEILSKKIELPIAEVKMAHKVIESMLEPFVPEEHVDSFNERLRAVLDAKAAHTEVPEMESEGEVPEDVSDLMAALEASLKRHPAGKGKGRKATTKTAKTA